MLLVFMLAAGIAIGLLMQLPRTAFETARNREEMLIERGEQYKRAVALFYRKNNRLPAKIEDLESTNNVRYLRRRYIDPMTGKDEWRIIHAGPGGVLTDSLNQKNPGMTDAKDKDGKPIPNQSGQNFGSNPGNTVGGPSTGTPDPTDGGVNAAVLRRPSDRITPVPGAGGVQTPGDPNQPGALPGQNPVGQAMNVQGPQPIYPGQPGYPQPGTPGYTGQPILPGQTGYPASMLPTGQPIFPGQPGYPQPGTSGYTGQPIYPGQAGYPAAGSTQNNLPIYPGQPGYPALGTLGYTGQPIYPGQPGYPQDSSRNPTATQGQSGFNQPGLPQQGGFPGQQQGGFPGQQQGGFPGQQQGGFNNTGGGIGQPNQDAVKMINDLIRNPRNPPAGTGSAFNNAGLQGGIAGFASTFKGPTIKIYKEHQKYQEWEFVYDIKDDPFMKQRTPQGGQNPTATNPLGPNPPARQPGR